MQKLKKVLTLLPKPYKTWLALENKGEEIDKNFRNSYDDIIMNLYKIQKGVCAYTEAFICPSELFKNENWETGNYVIPDDAEFKRTDHRGELDHFDPANKKIQYWNWDNLFMIDAKINGIKSDKPIEAYLKPDLTDYSPEKYFEYDDDTHRFIPHTDITDKTKIAQIQNMIDNVLCLNHGVVRKDRENYINELKDKKKRAQKYVVDRFFTSVRWTL